MPLAPHEEPYKSDKYGIMYYKNGHNCGVRKKFGNMSQCFSFGGKHCEKSEASLRALGSEVLKKLDGGMRRSKAKTWVRQAVAS